MSYSDETPSPPPFRAIRPGAPVDPLDRARDRAPRRVARPGGPAPTVVHERGTIVAPTAVDHRARTLRLDADVGPATPADVARLELELVIRACHATEIGACAARAAAEDGDLEAAARLLTTAIDTARMAIRALRGW